MYFGGYLLFVIQVSSVSPGLSFQESVSKALESNPVVLEKREKLKELRSQYWGSLSHFGPEIDFNFSLTKQKDAVAGGRARFNGDSFNFYSGSFQGSQPLFKKELWSGLGLAGIEEKIAKNELEQQVRKTTYEVLDLYEQNLKLQKQLDILNETKDVFKKSLSFTRERQKIGQSRKLDVLQVQSEIALIEPRISQSLRDLQIARKQLASLIFLPAENLDFQVSTELRLPKQDEVEPLTENRGSSLEDQIAELNLYKQKDEMGVALADHWPSLEGKGSFGRSGTEFGNLGDSDYNSWSVGIQLDWTIFSSLSYFTKRSEYQSLIRQKRLALSNQKRETEFERQKALEELRSSFEILNSSTGARDIVKAALLESRKQYRLSSIDYFRLLDAEQNLLQAEINLLDARSQVVKSLIDLFQSFSLEPGELVRLLSAS